MTRFARAKGSKASNEKLPEDASNWNELKGQKHKNTTTNDGTYKRRKEHEESVNINGNDVDIAYFDGFPVKKEDADRLKQLQVDMRKKGIPRKEVAIAMKLERRKAEKALARERKRVCFNCRQSGHVLHECPDLQGENTIDGAVGMGICFKCGSTEHTSSECKVVKSAKFKFANCFVCKEQGHIARQCPLNSTGLYPKGGACRTCGNINHLQKDCPQSQEQNESKNVAKTIDEGDIEGLDQVVKVDTTSTAATTKKKRKVVKM